ncbi:CapA family protein, partial [Candidatus Dojkabacteria bacterium]|nr:CapA family protein [Candidatus Dojkabacteria bacterium]
MKLRAKLSMLIAVVVIIGVSLVLYFGVYSMSLLSKSPKPTANHQTDVEDSSTQKNYVETQELPSVFVSLIPISKFTNTKTDYALSELKSSKLITLEENRDYVLDDFDVEFATSFVELNQKLEQGALGLLLPQQVTPRYKTLLIDGVNFWDKDTDIFKYPTTKLMSSSRSLGKEELAKIEQYDQKKVSNIFSTGEIIPARAVDRLGLNKYNDYTYLLDYFKDDLFNANISIGLLENSVLGDPVPCTGCMSFRGDDKVIGGLMYGGFDILSTAGNHAGHAGQEAYANTIKLINETERYYSGTDRADLEYPHIAEMEMNGTKVGLIGADDIASYYWLTEWYKPALDETYKTNSTNYGTYNFSTTKNGGLEVDEDKVKALSAIKKHYKIDYMIVYMSWGVEYT